MRSPTDHLERLVAERHSVVLKSLDALLNAIAANKQAEVKDRNQEFCEALEQMGFVVAREHWPPWLQSLLHASKIYRDNHQNGRGTWIAHLNAIIEHHDSVKNYSWFAKVEQEPVFDVDELVDAARSEFKIDELFDRIIVTLNALHELDEFDSIRAAKDLEEVVLVLRRAKDGSFASKVFSWQFVRSYVPKLIGIHLRRSNVTGPAIEAFEETAKELDLNIEQAKAKITKDLTDAAKTGFGALPQEEIENVDIPALTSASEPDQQ